MKKYFVLILFLFFCFPVHSENIQILNDIPGSGKTIINHSKVKVHYKGKLENGMEFDSSYKRKKPFSFQIGTRQVIEGWEIGLKGMKEGGKRTIIIPPNLGYGKTGAGNLIPPNSTLIFELEILEVQDPGYKVLKVNDIKKVIEKGFIFIDIRSQNEINLTESIPGSVNIPAFDNHGNILSSFLTKYQSLVSNSDNVVFVSNKGEISSILANGFVEHLGAKNMYSLSGGIQEYLKIVNN